MNKTKLPCRYFSVEVPRLLLGTGLSVMCLKVTINCSYGDKLKRYVWVQPCFVLFLGGTHVLLEVKTHAFHLSLGKANEGGDPVVSWST